jgi:CheY-like chemotaxis protein
VESVTAGHHPGTRPRVVIGEDSVLLLAGLTKLLEGAGFEVAATAGDAEELLAAVERERPDVVIADVRMPPAHTDEGIRAALVIRSQWPDIAILVLSQYVEERYAADLLSANTRGVGYLLKDRVRGPGDYRQRGEQAHQLDLRQARAVPGRRGPPQGTRGTALPRGGPAAGHAPIIMSVPAGHEVPGVACSASCGACGSSGGSSGSGAGCGRRWLR